MRGTKSGHADAFGPQIEVHLVDSTEPPTGVGDPTTGRGTVPRDDVAAVLARLLHERRAAHRLIYVNGGDQPLDQALEAVLSG